MPMGLRNGPPTFQRLMDMVLIGMQGREVFIYLDDMQVYANTLTEHNEKCRKVFDRLKKENLSLQPDKCEFLRREVVYLGPIIGNDGVKPNPEKVKAVRDFPRPRNIKNIRQFLGLTGYYRRFIEGYVEIAKPLSHLFNNNVPFIWRNNEEKSFQDLKDQLIEEPVLIFLDFFKPFIVTTDASGYAIGGILSGGVHNKTKWSSVASRRQCERCDATYALLPTVAKFRWFVFRCCASHRNFATFGNKRVRDVIMFTLPTRCDERPFLKSYCGFSLTRAHKSR